MTDVFILGAGFSKAISSEMPTLTELSNRVADRLIDKGISLPVEIANMGDNIEDWMSYLSQRQPWLKEYENDKNQSLAGEIREEMGNVIRSLTSQECQKFDSTEWPQWLFSLIKSWHDNKATVITLNYDTLVENAVEKAQIPSDVPNEGDLTTNDIYPGYLANLLTRTRSIISRGEKIKTFSYLKLHGSINWYYSGRTDFYGETIFYSRVRSRPLAELHRDKEILIIPPVYEKTGYLNNESVRSLWRDAGTALADSIRLFIIGYSLPISDLGMRFFLSNKAIKPEIYIVDIDPKLVPRFEEALPTRPIYGDFICGHDAVKKFTEQYAKSTINKVPL